MNESTKYGVSVGDTMTAINDKPFPGKSVAPPLKVGEDYVLKDITTCGCGEEHFNVGLASEYAYVSCKDCGEELPSGDTIHWAHPTRFTKKGE